MRAPLAQPTFKHSLWHLHPTKELSAFPAQRCELPPGLSLISGVTRAGRDNVAGLRSDPPPQRELEWIEGLKVIRLQRTRGSLLMSLLRVPTKQAALPGGCPSARWEGDCSAWWVKDQVHTSYCNFLWEAGQRELAVERWMVFSITAALLTWQDVHHVAGLCKLLPQCYECNHTLFYHFLLYHIEMILQH